MQLGLRLGKECQMKVFAGLAFRGMRTLSQACQALSGSLPGPGMLVEKQPSWVPLKVWCVFHTCDDKSDTVWIALTSLGRIHVAILEA